MLAVRLVVVVVLAARDDRGTGLDNGVRAAARGAALVKDEAFGAPRLPVLGPACTTAEA